jgi:hypothetical protein
MNTIKELIEKAEAFSTGTSPSEVIFAKYPEVNSALNDLVCDLKSTEASNINISGVRCQLTYLKLNLTEEEILKAINKAIEEDEDA